MNKICHVVFKMYNYKKTITWKVWIKHLNYKVKQWVVVFVWLLKQTMPVSAFDLLAWHHNTQHTTLWNKHSNRLQCTMLVKKHLNKAQHFKTSTIHATPQNNLKTSIQTHFNAQHETKASTNTTMHNTLSRHKNSTQTNNKCTSRCIQNLTWIPQFIWSLSYHSHSNLKLGGSYINPRKYTNKPFCNTKDLNGWCTDSATSQ